MSKAWKAFERKMAHLLGVERNSKLHPGEPVPDVISDVPLKETINLVLELKLKGKVSKFFEDCLAQVKNAKGTREDSVYMAVIKKKGHLYKDSLVITTWECLGKMIDFDKIPQKEEEGEE